MNTIKPFMTISLWFFLICTTVVKAAQTHEIIVNEKGFDLKHLKTGVYIGDTLVFINKGSNQHQIQSKSGLFFDSGLLNPGVSSNYTIKSQGSFLKAGHSAQLIFFDAEMPEHKLDLVIPNEPLILFPRDSWFLKKYPINILFLFGNFIANPFEGFIPVIRVKSIKLVVDRAQIFNGSYDDFAALDYITIEHSQGTGSVGYNAATLSFDPNTLSIGVHILNVSVILEDGSHHVDEVRYTILEPNFP